MSPEQQTIEQFPTTHVANAIAASRKATRHCEACGKLVQLRHYKRHHDYCVRVDPGPVRSRDHKPCYKCGIGFVPITLSHLTCFRCEKKDPIFDELDEKLKHGKYKPVTVGDFFTRNAERMLTIE